MSETATRFSVSDVQHFIEGMWRQANIAGRKQEVVRVVELDVPGFALWRVDCIEKIREVTVNYMIVVYSSEKQTLEIAFGKSEG